MKIRTKLTFIYTSVTALMLLMLMLYIYYFTSISIRRHFYEDLKERAMLTAQYYLEQDEVDAAKFNQIKRKFLRTLPNEAVRIYDKHNAEAFIADQMPFHYGAQFLQKVREDKSVELQENDRQLVAIYYPDNQGDFVIVVSALDEAGQERLVHLRDVLIVGFCACLLMVFFCGRFFARNALQPISKIIKRANEITGSNLHLRIQDSNGRDELSELVQTFNSMLQRIETVFEGQKSFVQHASHELRTPLTSMLVQLDVVLEKERESQEYKRTLQSLLTEVEKLSQLTTSLLNLAKSSFSGDESAYDLIYLDDLLVELKKEFEGQSLGRIIDLHLEMPANPVHLSVMGNRPLLYIAYFNLIDNAFKFSNNQDVRVVLKASKDGIVVSIIDRGFGINLKDSAHLYEPFYRGERSNDVAGFGVGLSLAKRIIDLHKGELTFESNPEGSGTVFSVFLRPIAD